MMLCAMACTLPLSRTVVAASLDPPPPSSAYLIKDIQIFETSVPGGTGAAFLTIENRSDTDDVLTSASSPQCDHIEIHTMNTDENNVMHMRELKDGLPLPARQDTRLTPDSGPHLMLIKLHDVLKQGEQVTLTLNFKHAPPQTVTTEVSARSIKNSH